MSSQYNWRLIDNLRGEKRINRKLDAMHPMGVIASQLKRCTVCTSNVDKHPMRYRIDCCKSDPCDPARPGCQFKLKTVCCDRTHQCHIYQHAEHAFPSGPDKRTELSPTELAVVQKRADTLWQAVPELRRFAEYFTRTWIKSKFCKWQCFWSPTGFAKTNNPVEQFNKVIRRDYTLRVRMKLCALLKKVLAVCRHRSIIHPSFALEPKPSTMLITRTKRLIKAKRVVVAQARQSVRFLLDGPSGRPSEYQGRSWIDPQDNAKNEGEGELNNRRMERLDQPAAGWTVDLGAGAAVAERFTSLELVCTSLLA